MDAVGSRPISEPVATPAWRTDPVAPTRRRWWDGTTWTARVADAAGIEGLAWLPDLTNLAPPTVAPPLRLAFAAANALSPVPLEAIPEQPLHNAAPLDPVAVAFGLEVPSDATPSSRRHGSPRHRRLVPALALFGVLAVAAGAGAGVLEQRPTTEPATVAYSDAGAGFALRYPAAWSIEKRTAGVGIRFTIGGRPDASRVDANTVKVEVSTTPAPLPTLDNLVQQVTADLRTRLPDIRLDEATRATLADGAALQLRFSDTGSVPPVRVLVIQGQTTDGRPLTVVVTIREPRTAPTERELARFLASITPA